MRSRSTPPRPPAPGTSSPPTGIAERGERRARATRPGSSAVGGGRRARRTVEAEPEPAGAFVGAALPPEVAAVLAPAELYRREKARRATQLDDDVMADARRILAEQMEASGKKRGVTITPRGRPPKPKPRPDDWDLEEFGEAQVLGRPAAAGSDAESDD